MRAILVLLSLLFINTASAVSDKYLGLHFVARGVSLSNATRIVEMAKDNGYTHIIVQLADGIALKEFPGTVREDAMSRDDFIEFIAYIYESDLKFIPEIKLLTHQEKFFQQSDSSMLYNKSTYDPRVDKVYKAVFAYLDEVIALSDPETVHIGHDEIAGLSKMFRKKWLNKGEDALPSDLFYADIMTLYSYFKERDIDVAMWGDMLISPKEPEIKGLKTAHGIPNGYGPPLRAKLPKDILIFDWHYNLNEDQLATIELFSRDGYEVVASVWKNTESSEMFMRSFEGNQELKVLVTLWWHVQKQEWDTVEKIIVDNSVIFHELYRSR